MDSKNPKNKIETPVEDNNIIMWCSYCGQKYRLRKELAGKTGTCDECQNEFVIPHVSQTKAEMEQAISFSCKKCNKKLLRPLKLAGKEITCHECGEKNIVPETIIEEESPLDLLEPFIVAETTRTDITAVRPASETQDKEENKILFWCNHCGQKYRLPSRLNGKAGVCSKCKNYLFIPHASQAKPTLKKTISFPCKKCGKTQLKGQELVGKEINCYKCGESNIVPEKSKKSLKNKVNPLSLLEPFLVAETTQTDLVMPEDKILFWCSHCGQKYRLPRTLDGKAGICTKCDNYLFIPHVSQEKPKKEISIVFPCKYCGERIRKSRKLIGEEVKCGKCSKRVIVPEKSKITALAKVGSKPEERILFWCSYCSQKYRLPKHLTGKTGTCDKCQKRFTIPAESQSKPILKDTIAFNCEHCGKELWEDQELIGCETQCTRCGEENFVPEKSKKTFMQKLETGNFFANTPKTMVGDPVKAMFSPDSQTVTKSSSKRSRDISKIAAEISAAKPSHKKELKLTDKLPTIHRIRNYVHEKAEKYLIFAMLVNVIDNIVDKLDAKQHPAKPFVLFFSFSLIIVLFMLSWNYAMASPPDKIINSRYNITCYKCDKSDVRRFKDINKVTCKECKNHVGFTYKCDKCNKSFACNEEDREKEDDDETSLKCPYCDSEDIHYLMPKKTSPKKR